MARSSGDEPRARPTAPNKSSAVTGHVLIANKKISPRKRAGIFGYIAVYSEMFCDIPIIKALADANKNWE
jgi:hypothetical protein